jgi:hypothetical protein
MNPSVPLYLLACAALLGCSRESRPQSPSATWSESTHLRHQPGDAHDALHARANSPCELAERAGRCRLEDLTTVESADSDREIVATYTVLAPATPHRIEHRARVWYAGADEAETLAHLRANPEVACRWQTVVRGECAAWPGRVEIPEMPGANASPRSRRHRAALESRHGAASRRPPATRSRHTYPRTRHASHARTFSKGSAN